MLTHPGLPFKVVADSFVQAETERILLISGEGLEAGVLSGHADTSCEPPAGG